MIKIEFDLITVCLLLGALFEGLKEAKQWRLASSNDTLTQEPVMKQIAHNNRETAQLKQRLVT